MAGTTTREGRIELLEELSLDARRRAAAAAEQGQSAMAEFATHLDEALRRTGRGAYPDAVPAMHLGAEAFGEAQDHLARSKGWAAVSQRWARERDALRGGQGE